MGWGSGGGGGGGGRGKKPGLRFFVFFFHGADRCYLCQPLFLPSLSLMFLLFRRRRQLCGALLLCVLACQASAVAAEKKGEKRKKRNHNNRPWIQTPVFIQSTAIFPPFFFLNPLRRDETQQLPPPSWRGVGQGRRGGGWGGQGSPFPSSSLITRQLLSCTAARGNRRERNVFPQKRGALALPR